MNQAAAAAAEEEENDDGRAPSTSDGALEKSETGRADVRTDADARTDADEDADRLHRRDGFTGASNRGWMGRDSSLVMVVHILVRRDRMNCNVRFGNCFLIRSIPPYCCLVPHCQDKIGEHKNQLTKPTVQFILPLSMQTCSRQGMEISKRHFKELRESHK